MRPVIATHIKEASQLFHALAEPTRLQILQELKDGEQCVCDLMDVFNAGQSRLSFHLRVLKEAGLINDRPEGRWMYYSLNVQGINEASSFLNALQESGRFGRSPTDCR